MKKFIFTTLALLIIQFFLAPTISEAKVLYEQSKIGTPYDIFSNAGPHTGLTQRLPQYSGTPPVLNSSGTISYRGTAEWVRLKRISGLECNTRIWLTLSEPDGFARIGDDVLYGRSNGEFCDFKVTGPNRTDGKVGIINICYNGQCDFPESFVLDGSRENEGYVSDAYHNAPEPGGWAFQICDIDGCEGGFEPVATSTATTTATTTPPTATSTGASSVLFLPGIQASRLYKAGLVGSEDQVWVPDGNQDVRQLAMTPSGTSVNNIYTKDILNKLLVGGTVYESFKTYMDSLVTDKIIKAWTPFAYDWRFSVADIAQNGTQYENQVRSVIQEIEFIANNNSFNGKVTIIGHSNGGLLAKLVVKKLEQEGKSKLIDRVVLLASPQLGTPKAIGTILHGYDQEKLGGWAIDDVEAREVIQNMPGAYGLVTSQEYFDAVADKVIRFENSTATQVFRIAYGESIDSEEELKRFMIGSSDNRPQAQGIDEVLRANESLLTTQLNLHGTTLDNWTAPAGVKVIEVVGTGLDTVSGFEYRTFKERVCTVLGIFSCETKAFYKPVPIFSQKGDKTVIELSAEGYSGVKDKYYIDLEASDIKGGQFQVEHYNISENPSIQKLISNILLATTSDIEFISTTTVSTNSNRLLLGVHSPVTIEVLDLEGKRVGRKLVSGVPTKEEGILGSTYLEIGTSKYVIVPAERNYTIKLKGTGEGGLTFSLDTLNGQTQIPQVFVNVATITASTSIGIKYTNNALSNIEIDTNGDTIIDTILTPLGVDITPKITYKTLRDKINTLSLSAIRKLPLLALVEVAETLDKKSLINPKLTTAEVYTLNQLESLLVTYQRKGWITQSNLIELKLIISKLK